LFRLVGSAAGGDDVLLPDPVDVELHAARRWPPFGVQKPFSGLVGGIWTPDDGQTNPIDTTMAYAKGARQRGVRVVEQAEVSAIVTGNGRVTGVRVRPLATRCRGCSRRSSRGF